MKEKTEVSLSIDADKYELILKIAEYTGQTANEVLSEAVDMYLQEEKKFIDEIDEAFDI